MKAKPACRCSSPLAQVQNVESGLSLIIVQQCDMARREVSTCGRMLQATDSMIGSGSRRLFMMDAAYEGHDRGAEVTAL